MTFEDFKVIARHFIAAAILAWSPYSHFMYILSAIIVAILIMGVLYETVSDEIINPDEYCSIPAHIILSVVDVAILLHLMAHKEWLLFTFLGIAFLHHNIDYVHNNIRHDKN